MIRDLKRVKYIDAVTDIHKKMPGLALGFLYPANARFWPRANPQAPKSLICSGTAASDPKRTLETRPTRFLALSNYAKLVITKGDNR